MHFGWVQGLRQAQVDPGLKTKKPTGIAGGLVCYLTGISLC